MTTIPYSILIQNVLKRLHDRACALEQDAALTGRMDDGGASVLRREIAAFNAGRNNTWPNKDWEEVAKQVIVEKDPEWETYVRLKAKFHDQ